MPATAVMPETMKARPVRARGDVHGLARGQAAVPLLDEAQQDERGELGADRHHERARSRR